MPEYADIYALSEDRTETAINHFLDHFLPSHLEIAEEYEIPQYSDSPEMIFAKASDLINHCCSNINEVHSIYWRSDELPEYAIIFFLADGGLILGISTPSHMPKRVDQIASDLEDFIGSNNVFITYEDTPPESIQEFRTLLMNLDSDPDENARETRIHRRIKVAEK